MVVVYNRRVWVVESGGDVCAWEGGEGHLVDNVHNPCWVLCRVWLHFSSKERAVAHHPFRRRQLDKVDFPSCKRVQRPTFWYKGIHECRASTLGVHNGRQQLRAMGGGEYRRERESE
jgi:hypothetical protein